jgi:hypothetical protein
MPREILDIELEPQCSDNWCYAAVIQAVNTYYGLAPISQKNIASTFLNSEAMQDPYNTLILMNLINNSKIRYGVKMGIPSWDDVVQSINNKKPLISKVGKHYILLIGYDGSSRTNKNRKYIFLDPLFGSYEAPIEITYETLKFSGFPTDYLHTGTLTYEPYIGTLFTKPPATKGGKRKTIKKKIYK